MNRKLLTMLLTFLVGGVTMAQTWTGNTPQAGDFYLYNVGAGKFLTSGCWWGTHAAMDDDGMLLTFAGSGNDYTLSTNVAFEGKYVGDNAYMDNGTAATWTFTQVSAGKYTMKNGSNYLVFKGGAVADNDATAPSSDNGYWQIVSRADLINNMKSATPSSPVDASFFMTNPKIRRNWRNSKPFSGDGFSDNGSFNASADGLYTGGCTSVGQYRKTFDNYQALTGLPNGKYQVTVKGQYRNNDNAYAIPYMYANDQQTNLKLKGDIGGDNATNATKSLVDDTYLTDAVTVTITDGNLRVGVKSDANVDWCTWREFTIKFLDPALSFAAETLPTTAVTAEKWYAVTIPTNDDYEITSSAAATLTYTYDGTKLVSLATGTNETFTAGQTKTINLSAGTVYIKSSAASTISISYKYNVGTATSSHAYVQPGQTVTISWAGASTNDPGASFAKNGNPNITFGSSSISVTPTSNGFTFTVPSVAVNGSYTLAIPANAFGYAAGSTYNAAQNITLKAPALFDGTYFFKTDADKFWMRGEPYGSAVQVYDWGMPVKVTTDGAATTLQFADANDWKIFSDGTGIYADNASPANGTWHMTVEAGKYKFQNAVNNHYMKVDGTRVLSTATVGEATAFTMVTPAAHQTVLTNYVNAQATAAATSASLSATTPSDLATAVSGWHAIDVITGSSPEHTAEKWQGGQWDSRTVYSNTVNITLPGLYKFTLQGFYRMTDNATTYALHTANADCPPVYVFFSDAKTPIKSVMDESRVSAYEGNNCDYAQDGNHYPNQQASSLVAFQEDKYTNTVWVYISAAGEYTYGIQYLGWAGSHSEWTCYTTESISLTLYSNVYIPGQDLTSLITNPSFEADGTKVQVASGEALTGNTITGWTVTDPSSMGDAGVYANEEAYARLGVKGTYLYNTWWFGRPLYQSIGTPQAGIYELTALVATGDRGTTDGTGVYGTVNLYATCNGTTYTSTGYASNSMNLLQRERLVFEADGTHPVTIGIKGGEDATNAYTPGAVNTDGYWCYNCDDFTLTYLCDANESAMATALSRMATTNAPYDGVTDVSTYETDYTTYAAYTSSNTKSELLTALNYIDNRYRDYRFANASPAHPYDLTDEVIWYASCATNGTPDDDTNAHRWYITSGRTFATGNHWSGDGSRQYMTQNVDGTTRAQTVKIPFRGYWRLRTTAKTTGDRSYVAITLTATDLSSAESVSERGNKGTTGGNVNIDGSEGTDNRANGNAGYGWYFLDLPFALSVHNAEKIISIGMGNGNHDYSWSAVGGMYLQYMGENYEETIDGIHYYYGYFPTAKTVEVTDAVPVADMTKATFGATATLTRTNPNGLAYTGAANPFATSTNVVVDGVCPSFVLADGHSLRIPYDFTASNASYTRSSVAPTGAGGVGAVGTLVLPFEITSAPDAVYRSADVSGITLRGRELTEVPGNTPVFITASGTYSGTGVPVRAVPDPAALQEDGELVGVYASTSAPNNSYVLQNHPSGGGVKFYIVDTSVATPTVTPFRAYVKAQSNNAPYLKFWFDEDETAIRRTEYTEEVEVTEIYDLQGRRLQRVTRPGLYIVNGKKVMMK